MSIDQELLSRAKEYTQKYQVALGDQLGSGVHGIVFATQRELADLLAAAAAIKVHARERDYARERDIYLRLKERGVTAIRGCRVPQLLRYDDDFWVIEMTIVSRPFVLDFAGAYLDKPPDFSAEVLADWHADKQEQFGRRWLEVQAILRALEGYGVFMEDVHPGNISFGD